jgi:hypothetical protein
MPAKIDVEKKGEGEFLVRVTEGKSTTSHRVTVRKEDYERMTAGKIAPEELLKRSFEFLLEHESKESILSQFDLTVIGRYFPNYEKEMRKRLESNA